MALDSRTNWYQTAEHDDFIFLYKQYNKTRLSQESIFDGSVWAWRGKFRASRIWKIDWLPSLVVGSSGNACDGPDIKNGFFKLQLCVGNQIRALNPHRVRIKSSGFRRVAPDCLGDLVCVCVGGGMAWVAYQYWPCCAPGAKRRPVWHRGPNTTAVPNRFKGLVTEARVCLWLCDRNGPVLWAAAAGVPCITTPISLEPTEENPVSGVIHNAPR